MLFNVIKIIAPNKFGSIRNSNKLIQQLAMPKTRKLSKSQKLKSEKLAKSKKLSKSWNLF